MKKLLLILICLPMIFSSCQENDPVPTSSSSSVCGTATLNVGSTNYTLNNPLMNADGTCSKIPSLHYNSVSFQNMYSNNWEHEWALKLQFIGAFTIGTSILGWDSTPPLFLAQLTLGSNTNNLTTVLYQSYLSLTSPNGEITITNIDSTNNTIDGNFSCTVYHSTNSTPQLISGSFSDIPLLEL